MEWQSQGPQGAQYLLLRPTSGGSVSDGAKGGQQELARTGAEMYACKCGRGWRKAWEPPVGGAGQMKAPMKGKDGNSTPALSGGHTDHTPHLRKGIFARLRPPPGPRRSALRAEGPGWELQDRSVVRLVELLTNHKAPCVGIIFISTKLTGKCVFLFRNSYLTSNS